MGELVAVETDNKGQPSTSWYNGGAPFLRLDTCLSESDESRIKSLSWLLNVVHVPNPVEVREDCSCLYVLVCYYYIFDVL